MTEKPLIDCKNLFFSYQKTPILENVNFTVFKNEFVGIFGPNGGGKTTLLHLLMGFLLPTKGSITLFGKDAKEGRKKIGWVPQSFQFDPSFPISVLEVVLMGRIGQSALFGGYHKEDVKEALAALEKVGLLHYKSHAFADLSGGEGQRVLIARALAHKPELLLLDEPTSHVDIKTQEKIFLLLRELKKELTILMVTHDLQVATQIVDRVFCVQRELTILNPSQLCKHFALGLYHPPEEEV